MERVSFVLRIHPEDYDEYVQRHQNVFAGLMKAFKKVGIMTYSIYYHEGLLFNYMEVGNFAAAMEQLQADSSYIEWQKFMSDMLLKDEEGTVSKIAPEVFHFHSLM